MFIFQTSAQDSGMKNAESPSQQYVDYVNKLVPKTRPFPSLLNAFWVGGVICCIGQLFADSLLLLMPSMEVSAASGFASMILIFLASFLTGIGVFDRIGKFAGAGTIVPITGFSNSITCAGMEAKSEGIVYGICVKMFTIAGPVIVFGVFSSVVIGFVYWIVSLF